MATKRKASNPIKGMGVKELAAKRAAQKNPRQRMVTLYDLNPRDPVFVVQWSTDRKKWNDRVTINDEMIVKEVVRGLAKRKPTYYWRVMKK